MGSDNKGLKVGQPCISCATLENLNNLIVPQFLVWQMEIIIVPTL